MDRCAAPRGLRAASLGPQRAAPLWGTPPRKANPRLCEISAQLLSLGGAPCRAPRGFLPWGLHRRLQEWASWPPIAEPSQAGVPLRRGAGSTAAWGQPGPRRGCSIGVGQVPSAPRRSTGGGVRLWHGRASPPGPAADLDLPADQTSRRSRAEPPHAQGAWTCATARSRVPALPGRCAHSHTHSRSHSPRAFAESPCSGPRESRPRECASPLPATCSDLPLPAAGRHGARGPPRPSGAAPLPAGTAGLPLGSPDCPLPQHLPPVRMWIRSPRGACPPGPSPSLPTPTLEVSLPQAPPHLSSAPTHHLSRSVSPKVPRPAAPCPPVPPSAAPGRLSAPSPGPLAAPAGPGSVRWPPRRVALAP